MPTVSHYEPRGLRKMTISSSDDATLPVQAFFLRTRERPCMNGVNEWSKIFVEHARNVTRE